jgi:hypothetical protein
MYCVKLADVGRPIAPVLLRVVVSTVKDSYSAVDHEKIKYF